MNYQRTIDLKDQYDGQSLEELTAATSDRKQVNIVKDGLSISRCTPFY